MQQPAMEKNSSHLTSLFEHATEGIIVTNSAGMIILVNPAAERLFGYTHEEINGQPVELLIPDRIRKKHVAHRDGFYDAPSNRVMGHGRDLAGRKKDGTDVPVEVSLSHYHHEGELYVIAFIVDIAARKQIEDDMVQQQKELERVSRELRSLNAELEEKVEERTVILKEALEQLELSQKELSEALNKEKHLNEIKSRFVSMASHEFRTPLSTVLSSATLISKYTSGEESGKRERHVKKIKDSVSHLNDLLEDFLSLGKLEEGKMTAVPVPFSVREFAEDVVDEMRIQLKPKQEILLELRGEDRFRTDKRLLKNILINLISNAIKFSDPGSSIWVSVSNDGNAMQVSVRDEGVGIPETDKAHLFTNFYRASNVTNIQGTGLGLAIVKRYADLLQGKVSVESELGKGTVVTLHLAPMA